jgi:hypothetical protein
MATRTAVQSSFDSGNGQSVYWSGLAGGTADVGDAIQLPAHGAMSVQVGGTFGTSTLSIQGSNDGTTWTTLVDMQGSNMAFTSAAFKTIRDVPRYIRPSVPSGTGTGLWVSLYARRS